MSAVTLVKLALREGQDIAGTIVGQNSANKWRNALRILNRLPIFTLLAAGLLAACARGTAPVTSQVSPQAPASPVATQTVGIPGAQPGCTVVSRQPTPDPTEQALIPPVGEGDWIKGAENAQITLLEYSDFQ